MRVVANRYEVLGELGRGGMGVVWRARDRVIGRMVALKEIRSGDDQRILREAQTAGRLNDPGVVAVHDVVTEPGATYIVMELVEAPTLADLMARGPLAPEQVSAIALQVLGALETAHAAGIVHRDVKPSNIMVLPDGRAKLADFGIARAMDDPGTTTKGGIMGSPGYMAPELFTGSGPGPASDLWALGATLFHAVEGRSPFQRDTTAATLHAILYDGRAEPSCGGALAAVITGLLSRPVETRLTAPQVRDLLTNGVLDDATRVVAVEQPTQYIDAYVPMTPQLPHWHEPEPEPEPRGRRKGVLIAACAAVVVAVAVGVVLALCPMLTTGTAAAGAEPAAETTTATATQTGPTSTSAKPSQSSSTATSPVTSSAQPGAPTVTAPQSPTVTGAPAPGTPPPGQPQPTAQPPARTKVALSRYHRPGTRGHFSSTPGVPPPSGFVREAVLGALVADAEPGTRKLYACRVTGLDDWFSSVDAGCEGQQVLGVLGHLFTSQPEGVRSHAVYRCNAGADHFDSVSATCEGQKVEFRIGYLIS